MLKGLFRRRAVDPIGQAVAMTGADSVSYVDGSWIIATRDRSRHAVMQAAAEQLRADGFDAGVSLREPGFLLGATARRK